MENTLLLVKDLDLYFYSLIDACDCAPVYPGGKFVADKYINHWSETGEFDVADFGSWKDNLSKYKLIVFMDFGYETYISEYIRSKTDARTVLFLWNAVDEAKLELLARVKESGSIDDIYTFDPIDANKHNIKHNTTFYYPILEYKKEQFPLIHDVYFGGTDKNRGPLILETKAKIEELGLKFLLHCPGLEGSVSEDYILYPEYLTMALQSKSLLEILKTGQTGISLRSMESLFYEKKLITQNSVVKHYRFYNPNNIFIWGEDDIERLPEFIATPYEKVEQEIVDFFSFEKWIKRFYENDSVALNQYAFSKDGVDLIA